MVTILTPRSPEKEENREIVWCRSCNRAINLSGDGTHAIHNSLEPFCSLFTFVTDDEWATRFMRHEYDFTYPNGCLRDNGFRCDVSMVFTITDCRGHKSSLHIFVEVDGPGHDSAGEKARDTVSTLYAMDYIARLNSKSADTHKCLVIRVHLNVSKVQNGDRAYLIRMWILDAMVRFMKSVSDGTDDTFPPYFAYYWRKPLPELIATHHLGAEINHVPAPINSGSWFPHPTRFLYEDTTGVRYDVLPPDEFPFVTTTERSPLEGYRRLYVPIQHSELADALVPWNDVVRKTAILLNWHPARPDSRPVFMARH